MNILSKIFAILILFLIFYIFSNLTTLIPYFNNVIIGPTSSSLLYNSNPIKDIYKQYSKYVTGTFVSGVKNVNPYNTFTFNDASVTLYQTDIGFNLLTKNITLDNSKRNYVYLLSTKNTITDDSYYINIGEVVSQKSQYLYISEISDSNFNLSDYPYILIADKNTLKVLYYAQLK